MDPIRELANEGTKDSSGSFTLDLLAARRKLARAAQLEPGLMLGKLLQAAVAANAHQIRFSLTASQVSAKVVFPDSYEADAKVQSYVATAVALAQNLNPRSLSWDCGGVQVNLFEGNQPLKVTGVATFNYEAGSLSFWEGLRSLIQARTSSHRFLHERAYRCPIPIYLDAVRIYLELPNLEGQNCDILRLAPTGLEPRHHFLGPTPQRCKAATTCIGGRTFVGKNSFGGSRLSRPKFVILGAEEPTFLEHEGPVCRGVALANECDVYSTITNTTTFRVLRQWDWTNPQAYLAPGQSNCLRIQRWFSFQGANFPSQLYPVQDGLRLNPSPLANCPQGGKVVSVVDGLSCDLDQLNLVRDEAFLAFERELAGDIERLSSAYWKTG